MRQRAVIDVERTFGRRGLLVGLVLALSVALLAPAAATAADEGSEPADGASAPAAVRDQAQDDGFVRVLVELDVPATPEGALSPERAASQRHGIDRAQEAVLDAIDPRERRVTARLQRIPLLGLRVTPAGLQLLEQAPRVVDIAADEAHRPLRGGTVPHVGAADAYAGPQGQGQGSGQTVAVIDTGVDATHPAFDATAIQEACFVSSNGGGCPDGGAEQTGEGSAAPPPDDGHGTHVAGTAVGAATDRTHQGRSDGPGVAPAADLLAVRVFPESGGAAYQSDIVRAMEHVAAEAETGEPIAAVNLSLGTGATYQTACDDDAYEQASALLASHGVATVAATGNDSSASGVSKPACVEGVVGVGATAIPEELDDGDTHPSEVGIASYSNTGGGLADLVAPGNVVAPVPGGGLDFLRGTSMAAPHVAGAWAVLQQATEERITPASALEVLRATAELVPDDRGAGSDPPEHREVRLSAAIDSLAEPTGGISGEVTDSGSGDAISDAKVVAVGERSFSAHTGSAGSYLLRLAPATYTVTAEADGYEPATAAEVAVPESRTATVNLRLEPATRLAVTVTDGGGQPIEGASVDAGSGALTGTTDATGEVRWSSGEDADVPTGEVTVTATADGYQDASQTTEVAPDEANEVGLSLEAAGGGLLQPILDLLSLGGLGL